MCFISPKVPKTPAAPPAPPPAPTMQEVQGEMAETARVDERKRQRRLAAGLQSTYLTSGSGLGSAPTMRKTLLGQ